jgi:hypothetical protein
MHNHQALGVPLLALAQRQVEHQHGDGRHVVGALDKVEKVPGLQQTMRGMLPADQGFHTAQAAIP